MCRLLLLSWFLTFSVSAVARADNPQVEAIRQRIRALREEEKSAIVRVKSYYKAIRENKKLDEREKARLRETLLAEERQALSIAQGEEHREKIRAHFNHLRRVLLGEIRLDERGLRRLHEEEGEHIRHVQAYYHAKIRELEEAIKAASQGKRKRR